MGKVKKDCAHFPLFALEDNFTLQGKRFLELNIVWHVAWKYSQHSAIRIIHITKYINLLKISQIMVLINFIIISYVLQHLFLF